MMPRTKTHYALLLIALPAVAGCLGDDVAPETGPTQEAEPTPNQEDVPEEAPQDTPAPATAEPQNESEAVDEPEEEAVDLVDEVAVRFNDGARRVMVEVLNGTVVWVNITNGRAQEDGTFADGGLDWACGNARTLHVRSGESELLHDYSWTESNGRALHVEGNGEEYVFMDTHASEGHGSHHYSSSKGFYARQGDVFVLTLSTRQSGQLHAPEIVLDARKPVLSVVGDQEVGFACGADMAVFQGFIIKSGLPGRPALVQDATASLLTGLEARFHIHFDDDQAHCRAVITVDEESVQEDEGRICTLAWTGGSGAIGLQVPEARGLGLRLAYYAWGA